jgi:cysteine desulfurase/selenocysteine lyase
MIGLKCAIDYAMSWGMDAIWERILHLSTLLRKKLSENPRVTLLDLGIEKCGLVTFTLKGMESLEVKRRLNEMGINVSVSKAEYSLLDLQKRGLTDLVRASVHYYNTEAEVERFCKSIKSFPEL